MPNRDSFFLVCLFALVATVAGATSAGATGNGIHQLAKLAKQALDEQDIPKAQTMVKAILDATGQPAALPRCKFEPPSSVYADFYSSVDRDGKNTIYYGSIYSGATVEKLGPVIHSIYNLVKVKVVSNPYVEWRYPPPSVVSNGANGWVYESNLNCD